MTFDPNDPRLTAYALGELDSSERESVESLLKESDEARQAIEEIRLMVGWLTRELHREQETYAQQPALNHQPLAGSFAKPSPARRSWWSRNAFKLGALAALLLLTVGLVRVAITPRGEPAASAPNLVAAAKARGVAGEFDAEERILAETPPVASELAAKPAVLMTAAPRPAQAAPAAPAPLGLARDSLGLQPVRRWSVVKASAAVELAFYVPGASPAQTLALNAATGKDAYATQDVKDQPLRESEAIQYRQPNQANQVQGLGGGAAMMNNRGSLPNRQPVSGSHAAKVMAPAQSLGRSDLSQRGGQVPKASMAPAGAAVASNDRSPRSMSPQRAPERLTEGASETSMAGATPAAAANQVEKLEDPSQISGQAHSILESKAKSTFAFEVPQPATPTDGPFRLVRHMPRSTFPIDVDTSSYATIRRDLTEDRLPPKDTVRIEELLNELPYHDAAPSPVSPDPFALHVEIAGCPWDQRLRLARVGITARPIDQANRPPCNLVFLIDVSSSMRQADRLPLVQWSLEKLTDQLGARDRLAIVTFGQTAGLVLASTSGMAKSKIRAAVDDLRVEVQDGTRSGLALAYELAGRSFIEQGTNRVILVTDASARIGAMGRDDLIGSRKTSNRVSLSVIGVGGGSALDSTIASLASMGRGRHAQIGSPLEAYRALVAELGMKLTTIATDAKVQVQFNATRASAYRLIGYDGASVPPAPSIDDSKDAGAIVEGHHVTALYEIAPPEAMDLAKRSTVDFRESRAQPLGTFTIRLSYRKPGEGGSRMIEERAVDSGTSFDRASNDMKLAAAAAGFGMLLRRSPFARGASYDAVEQIVQPLLAEGNDPTGDYREFADLIARARALSGAPE